MEYKNIKIGMYVKILLSDREPLKGFVIFKGKNKIGIKCNDRFLSKLPEQLIEITDQKEILLAIFERSV